MLIERRVLLRRGVSATLLLPAFMADAVAAPRHHAREKAAAPAATQKPLVMLDPGHGGKDPGAIGVSGTYEKHVALSTAFELKRQLEASGKYRVAMTRARDVFIPLEDRVSIADEHRAALFVSMHADSLTDHAVRGASVYTLSRTASDAQSAALAQRENSVDRYDTGPFRHYRPEVARILSSLMRREVKLASARLQESMVTNLDNNLPMLTRPARHARFEVLKAADIPSVLVEMGFMSNRQDEALLRQKAHQAKVARDMHHAVDAYFAALHDHTLLAG